MASSRIFVKNLPPNITEVDFRKHFSTKHTLTDAKLIANRRIGYVGYKTPEEAAHAVKYFNKSFIRMSRLGVELARPLTDLTATDSKTNQEHDARTDKPGGHVPSAQLAVSAQDRKRKRPDVAAEDAQLQEYLDLNKSSQAQKSWQNLRDFQDDEDEPPQKLHARDGSSDVSDEEYQDFAKTSMKTKPPPNTAAPPADPEPPIVAETEQPIDIAATDDDWLRGRTNRLLDLLDPTVLQKPQPLQQSKDQPPVRDAAQEVAPEQPDDNGNEETSDGDPLIQQIRTTGRLFLRNLPYDVTNDDLIALCEPFGTTEDISLPLNAKGDGKGFAMIQFREPASAVQAYTALDKHPFQGRLVHILPAEAKRNKKLDDFAISKLPLKKQKQIRQKADAQSSSFNWNALYMSQDAVNASAAHRLGISKSELLDATSSSAAVKQAMAETTIIQETKSYFKKHGVDLGAFKNKQRGDTTILVKNFPFGTTVDEMRTMCEEFGQVLRVLMPPAGTIAIVQYALPGHASAAFAGLAYRRIQDSVLFLEKAPKDIFTSSAVDDVEKPDTPDDAPATALDSENIESSTLFVRNLNFVTDDSSLSRLFKPLEGYISARINNKPDPKKPGQTLSMGYGFVHFQTKLSALAAMKAMDGYTLDGHKLHVRASHKGADAAEERRKDDHSKKVANRRTKIVIKNLPFQADKKDIRDLFSAYGQLRSVRVPRKMRSNAARGFGFADFITAREAENALEALKDTHLLGRRLVLEFAADDPLDAEEEIAKMQEKVERQTNKVALQGLYSGDRKKFLVDGLEGDEG